jgi:hypothetical protein
MPYQGRLPYTYKSPYNTTLDQGTQTVPSLAFLGDTNNGLFSPATDNVAITTNGSEKLRVTDVGNVGIGITNPDKKFIVYGSGGNFVSEFYNTNDAVSNNGVYIRTLNTNSATYPLSVNSGTNGSNQLLLIRADGNIGIGTTNPITTLDIRSSSSEALYLRRSDNANAYGFLGISGSNFRIGAYIAGTGWGNIILNDGGGGVGIGTTNPTSKLNVYNGDLELSGGYNLTWGGTFSGGNPTIWGNSSNKTIRFAPDGNTTGLVALLGASSSYILGNVGIGTTDPVGKLTVHASNANSVSTEDYNTTSSINIIGHPSYVRLQLGTGGPSLGPYGGWIQASYDNTPGSNPNATGNSGVEPLLLNPIGGNVGIGTTNPQKTLHIYSSSPIRFEDQNRQWDINIKSGKLVIGDNTGSADRLTIDTAGNVGIGTTNPSVKFEVWDGQTTLSGRAKANTGTTFKLSTTDSSSKMELLFDHATSAYWRIQSVEQDVAYRPLILQNDGGNVGIGITTPSYALHAKSTTSNAVAVIESTYSGDNVQLRFKGPNGEKWAIGNNVTTGGTGTNFDIFDLVSSTGRFRIGSTGNIGIGTTDPSTHLDVRGKQKIENNVNAEGATLFLRNTSTGSTAYSVIRFSESQDIGLGADAYIHYFNTNWGSNGYWDAKSLASGTTDGNINFSVGGNNIFKIWTNGVPRLYVMGNGNVGIGTTNPVKSLDVRGEATFGAGVTISDLSWGKDTNQLVYTFSGVASGVNPADGTIALVSPNTNPSATRIGSLVFGNKVSGPFATSNPGLKAGIECGTNTNVANAADTGGLLNFYTKPDNVTFRVQMTLNSNGILTTPYQPAFLAFRNTALSHPSGWQLISNDILTESYDVGPVYSTSTNGRFVAPVTGKYMFYAGGYSSSSTSGERYAFGVKINNSGSPDFIAGGNYSLLDSPLAAYQVVLHLNANDYVELHFFSAVATTLGGGTHPLYWGGYLLG